MQMNAMNSATRLWLGMFSAFFYLCIGAGAAHADWVGADSASITYFGRVRVRAEGSGTPYGKNGAALNYTGSGFTTRINGTSAMLMLTCFAYQYDAGTEGKPIDFVAVVDGNEANKYRFSVYPGYFQWYTVASGLSDGTHTLTVRRVSDTQVQVTMTGIWLDSGRTAQAADPLPTRRIEFYGDSVTSGGSVEPIVSSPNPNNDGDYRSNNDLTFGAVTAKALGADARWISQGGTGLVQGYSIVPLRDFWNLWDYDGFYRSDDPAVAYPFSNWTPRVVVVAIGHNDRQNSVARSSWVSAFATFINNLKTTYPGADIICMNTMISDPSDGWWDAAIDPLVSSGSRVHKLRFSVQNHSGHPHVEDHQTMATALTQKIQEITGWTGSGNGNGNLLTNGGFEADGDYTQTPTGWSEWSSVGGNGSSYVETNGGAQAGTRHLTFWRNQAYNIYTYQVKTGLTNGTYRVRAYVRGGGSFNALSLVLKQYNGSAETSKDIKSVLTGSYQLIEQTVSVTSGKIEVGFWADASANAWVHIDSVELVKL